MILKDELGGIIATLKDKGLDVTEEIVMVIWVELLALIEKFVQATPGGFDDLILVVKPQLNDFVVNLIDKIDGEKDLP